MIFLWLKGWIFIKDKKLKKDIKVRLPIERGSCHNGPVVSLVTWGKVWGYGDKGQEFMVFMPLEYPKCVRFIIYISHFEDIVL